MDDTKVAVRSVPELHPSAEEFMHPIRYLSQPAVAQMGEKYGILKVVPPAGWKPKFALDWDTFRFHTRIQRLHELNLRNRSRACFVEGFNCFLQSTGSEPLETTEDLCLGVADDFPLKTWQLRKLHLNGWLELKDGSKVHIHDIFISKEYRKWFYRVHEMDKELLKKLTTYSKRLLSMLGLTQSASEGGREPDSLVVPPEVSHTTLQRLMMSPAALLAQPESLKRLQRMKTRIAKSSSRMSQSQGESRKRRRRMDYEDSDPLTPPAEKSARYEDEGVSRHNQRPATTTAFPLTPEILSPEALDETCVVCHCSDSPETTLLCDGCSRAFHMRCLPVPLERVPKYDWFCGECLVGSTGIYSDYGFEEEFDKRFSLNEFRKYCEEWEIEFLQLLRKGRLGSELKLKPEEITNALSEETIEKIFWNLTNGKMHIPSGMDHLKIRYGADIHSSVPGELSGFPSSDNPRMGAEDEEYIKSEWNLTKLPFARGSLLEYVCGSLYSGSAKGEEAAAASREQISGMSLPWMYVGGPLSTFCWHKEDHYTLSANYSHLGAPKKWYGIPAKDCDAFEEIINGIAPEYEAKQRDLMHQLVSMVSPEELLREEKGMASAGGDGSKTRALEIYETIQRPGEFIVTFPKVYHSGFNYGFNVNEAVNFTLPLWVPYSVSAVDEYERVSKECVFDTFALLRRIITDLGTEEGRALWMRDTGVSREEVDGILRWVYEKYVAEVRKFLVVLQDEALPGVLDRMRRVGLQDYLREQGAKQSKEEGDGEEDEDAEADDRLCRDCKTRVHFQWVLVDLYEDCMHELGVDEKDRSLLLAAEERVESPAAPLSGLGITRRHKDVESEWRELVERAGDQEADGASQEGGRRFSRRLLRRRQPKPVPPQQQQPTRAEQQRRELVGSLLALRRENAFFGRCVFCLRCFAAELRRLSAAERARVAFHGVLVEEYITAELCGAVAPV